MCIAELSYKPKTLEKNLSPEIFNWTIFNIQQGISKSFDFKYPWDEFIVYIML